MNDKFRLNNFHIASIILFWTTTFIQKIFTWLPRYHEWQISFKVVLRNMQTISLQKKTEKMWRIGLLEYEWQISFKWFLQSFHINMNDNFHSNDFHIASIIWIWMTTFIQMIFK